MKNSIISWENGKYIKADGIFTEVLKKEGNVYTVRKLNTDKIFYLVSNGSVHAHGDTVEAATEDFKFKLVQEKFKNDPITGDTIINVNYYRMMTGACKLGVEQWMKENNITVTEMKASELLVILEKTNAYGATKFKSLLQN